MAVIIENMEMPKCCLDCKFYKYPAPHEIPYCQIGKYVTDPHKRADFCPLKEYKENKIE